MGGKGLGDLGNARKKTFFFPLMSSLNRYVPLCHCHYQSWLRTKIKCHYQGSCEHSKIVSAMELCVLVPFLIYTKSPCSQIFGTCFGFATGLWISNNETTRYSWRREQAAASKPISSHWLSGFQRNLSSHYCKSRVGPLIAGKAAWRKLEGTSCSRSTLHRAVQLVNNPLKACKRKCALFLWNSKYQ